MSFKSIFGFYWSTFSIVTILSFDLDETLFLLLFDFFFFGFFSGLKDSREFSFVYCNLNWSPSIKSPSKRSPLHPRYWHPIFDCLMM
eukprot:UN11771